ncbi:MAG: PEP-CTERM sorting domain-containing protein [Armatimonadota bacterium]
MQYGSRLRVAGVLLAVVSVALLFAGTAGAEPWPAWDASTLDPNIHVTASIDQATGYHKYVVAIDPEVLERNQTYVAGALNYWHDFRAFVVYPTNIGSYQPPADNSFYVKDDLGNPLPIANTPDWTSTNGGFQLKGETPDGTVVPAVPEDPSPSACFGWRGGGINDGWMTITNLPEDEQGRYQATFYANLPDEASGWTQTHFSLHVRDGGTWWAANARGDYSVPPTVPEPSTMLLLGVGSLGLLGARAKARRSRAKD